MFGVGNQAAQSWPHYLFVPKGAKPDWGPQAEGLAGCCQDRQGVVHQSEKNEGHLPHSQPLQHRCDTEVSDRRGVVSCLRPGLHPVCSAERDGESDDAWSGLWRISHYAGCVMTVVETFWNRGSTSLRSRSLQVGEKSWATSFRYWRTAVCVCVNTCVYNLPNLVWVQGEILKIKENGI